MIITNLYMINEMLWHDFHKVFTQILNRFYSPLWIVWPMQKLSQKERSTTTLCSVVSFVLSRSGPEHDSLDRNLIIDKKCVTRLEILCWSSRFYKTFLEHFQTQFDELRNQWVDFLWNVYFTDLARFEVSSHLKVNSFH